MENANKYVLKIRKNGVVEKKKIEYGGKWRDAIGELGNVSGDLLLIISFNGVRKYVEFEILFRCDNGLNDCFDYFLNVFDNDELDVPDNIDFANDYGRSRVIFDLFWWDKSKRGGEWERACELNANSNIVSINEFFRLLNEFRELFLESLWE